MKSVTRRLSMLFVIFTSFSCVVAQAPMAAQPSTVVPRLVSFSGKAVDAQGKPVFGTAGATFAIYKDQSGGTPLWIETQNVAADAKGNYTAQLGATKSEGLPLDLFISGEGRWLGVRVNGGEEQPRVMLLSVPYALKAGDAATLGGMPLSAFVLAAPSSATAAGSTAGLPASVPATNPAVTGAGTAGAIPLWDGASDIVNSAVTQTGSGTTAKIGINTLAPATALDVKGAATVRGALNLTATGTATAAAGKNSQALNLTASSFDSATGKAANQAFRWQAEPAANNTANPGATLNLLFSSNAGASQETGLHVAGNGLISFASGQTFPGTGAGTITGVVAGAGLTGGGTAGTISLSVPSQGITNAMLATPSLTVAAGTDLTGGGPVTLGGTTTLKLDTTKVPQLNAANLFHGDQSVVGNVSVAAGYGFNIGGAPFAIGSAATGNVLFGFAGNSAMTGTANTATGYQALAANTVGRSNTANGYQALALNSSGLFNVASGYQAMYSNTFGSQNVATGWSSLYSNTTGSQNVAIGSAALVSNTTGSSNTVNGFGTMFLNTTGGANTADGYEALYSNTAGNSNTAVGLQALYSNTVGTYNTATGYQALYTNASSESALSSDNTADGAQALYFNNTGTANTASGFQAMYNNSSGFFNTADGYQALYKANGGNENTAIGYQALYSNSMGGGNTATGYAALFANNSGVYNTAVGAGAMAHNLYADNTGVGYEALVAATATDNVAMGYIAAVSDTLGGQNTVVGSQSLGSNTTGNDITCIGFMCDTASDGLSNATAIGAHSVVGQSNSLVLGGTGAYAVKVGIGTTEPSAILTIARGAGHPVSDSWETYSSRRWKTNIQTLPNALAKVEQLRGVTYDLKDSGKHEIGVIAEEVGEVVPELVSYEANGKDARGVDYSRLTALLIEAVKQQQGQIQQQRAQITRLSHKVGTLEASLHTAAPTKPSRLSSASPAEPQTTPATTANGTDRISEIKTTRARGR
jgi:hypothetical protein